MIKVITHTHTIFSQDGFITPSTFTKQCQKRQLDCVCITDHNTIQGAVEFSKSVGVKIVIGEEVETGEGDLVGLFLSREIVPGLGLEKTAIQIKQQGGLVYLPHPFDEFRKSSVKIADAERIKHLIDIIEIFNSRTFNSQYCKMAEKFASINNIAVSVGSDAHHPLEYKNAYVLMEDFDSPQSFLENLKKARLFARKCPLFLRVYIKGLKILTGKN
jgi:predicted metal-dependent phosphoesterase TrpH